MIKKTVVKMGIKFDKWFSEKSLYPQKIQMALKILEGRGLVYKKDGAIWLKTSKFGDDKDRVLYRQDKTPTYFISDIAYHLDKLQREYHLLLNLWGADHHGYVERLKIAAEKILGPEVGWSGKLEIIIMQLVRLISAGKEVKMSKRLGTYVTLDELIDEVGLDVSRFFFLMHSPGTHMDFDLDLAKERSEKNPVYYVQYAHARICSILAKSKILNSKSQTNSPPAKAIAWRLRAGKFQIPNSKQIVPAELTLLKQIVRLPDIVAEISQDYQVQKLPFYSVDLATAFHNFYEKCRVIDKDSSDQTAWRLQLVLATQIVLQNTLGLMGVSAPEKM